jgi:hypothetical protein
MTEATSNSEYVIIFSDKKKMTAKLMTDLRKIGHIEQLSGVSLGFVVKLEKPAQSGKQGWAQLTELLNGKADVFPVFEDESQTQRYPIGKLQVRFPTRPTDRQLKEICQSQGLKISGRNEFTPDQVAFELKKPSDHYLPDLVQELSQEQGPLTKVWPVTLSQFRRGV